MAQLPFDKTILSRFAGRLAGNYIRLVKRSSSVVTYPDDTQALLHAEYPYILAIWHGQFMLLPPFSPPDLPISNMVALHKDGEIIAEALKSFDMELVRGGGAAGRRRDRGGAKAFREALRLLQEGRAIAMTADVPPGPARTAGIGIVKLAARSGRPIIPVATASSRYWALDTWSRMTINLPFSRISATHGDPIYVSADATDEELERSRQKVEDALNQATQRAYDLIGADLAGATPPSAWPADAPPQRPGKRLGLYRLATRAAEPLMPLLFRYRERNGKELAERRGERMGIASAQRPNGTLIWLHAASVGETNAILPLINAMRRRQPALKFLLTTGTVTSAAIASERLSPQDIHQFAPLDIPKYVNRFLDHWTPDVCVLTESEIWPNILFSCHDRNVPVALVNARISERSYKRWRRNRSVARPLFNRICRVLAQNERLARRFRDLGSRDCRITGNLKVDAPPLTVDNDARDKLTEAIGSRPVLLGASTHAGEERHLIGAYQILRRTYHDMLLIIAPRHPERAAAIADEFEQPNLQFARRSLNEEIQSSTNVYIADTVGEMGTLYSLCPVSFIGGSLVERGGHNPIEAIRLNSVVLAGPSRFNFTDAYGELVAHGGVIEVRNGDDMAATVERLWRHEIDIDQIRVKAGQALMKMDGALDATVDALFELVPQSGGDLQRAS